MKILINATMLDDKPTGLGQYILNILNQFDKMGIKYSIFTSIDIKKNNIKLIKTTKFVRPYPYKKLAGITRFVINQTIFPSIAKNYDIVYFPSTYGSFLLENQIITVHDLIGLYFSQHILQYLYFKYALKFILKKAKIIITISKNTKNDVIKFFDVNPQKIKVVYNGINHEVFYPRKNSKTYILHRYKISDYILAVGSSYPHKNIHRLIEAFIKFQKMYPHITLAITGYPTPYQKELIKKYNLENVKFLGYIPLGDMPYLYSVAKCLVYPSLYEGFGLPPLEAMACGCPVAVSNSSSLPEVCGNAAIFFDPYSVEDIKNAIEQVFINKNLKQNLIKKGLIQARKYNWGRTAKKIIEIFEEII